MQGKICLVTGATSGIGRETALALAKMGAAVVIAGRSAEKVTTTAAAIRSITGAAVDTLVADLSSMAQVVSMADAFKAKFDRLDVLVNNAGAVFTERQESVDGFEMTFALNHLSYFLLTAHLREMLIASGRPGAAARIVNVASDAHRGGKMKFDDLQFRQGYFGFTAYAQSKLANILFSNELARQLEGKPLTSNALHPGFVSTGFGRGNGGFSGTMMKLVMTLLSPVALTPEKGAQTSIYLASSPEVEGVSGKYFDKSKAVTPSAAAQDMDAARRLWIISEDLTAPWLQPQSMVSRMNL